MGTTISTDGWDMIASATQGSINSILSGISNARPSAVSINKEIPIGDTRLNIGLDATFGALQINALQQGLTLMNVVIPITEGAITLPVNNQQTLDGLELVVQMALTYVKSELQPTTGTSYDFVVDFTNPDAFNKFTLENVPTWLADDPFMKATIQTLMLGVLVEWATENPSVVITTVNLGDVSSAFPALVPSQAFYSFNLDENVADDTPFSILMLTTGTEQGQFNTGNSYIPTSSNSSVLISNNILMSGIFLPAIASAFQAPQSDFKVSGGVLTLNTSSIEFSSDGDSIDVSAFTLQINDANQIAISMEASTTVWGVIDVAMSASGNLAFTVSQPSSSGEQNIDLVVQGTPDTSVKASLPWWLSWASWILALIIPFVGIFAALLVSITNLLIGALGLSASAKVDSTFAGYALGQVVWPQADLIEVDSIELPDIVQIGATIAPDSQSS